MRADLLVFLGTIGLFTLGNPTARILACSRRSNPSPRLLTHKKTPHQVVDKLKVATQCTPPMNGAVPTSPHTKTCRPKRGGTQTNLLTKTRWQARTVRPAAYAFASRDSAEP